MATSASGVSFLLAQPPPSANGTSLWRGVVAARAPAPARFAALAAKANAKRRTLRFVSVSVRCVGVGGTEALRSDAAEPAVRAGMTKNTHFLEQVSRIFGKDDEIIVGCQSGKRSLMAATELCSACYTAVTDIAGGFSAWRENELPIIH